MSIVPLITHQATDWVFWLISIRTCSSASWFICESIWTTHLEMLPWTWVNFVNTKYANIIDCNFVCMDGIWVHWQWKHTDVRETATINFRSAWNWAMIRTCAESTVATKGQEIALINKTCKLLSCCSTLSELHKHKSSKRRRGSVHDAGRQFLNYYSNFHGFLSRIIRALQHSSTWLCRSLKGEQDSLTELKEVSTCHLHYSLQRRRRKCFQASSLLMKSNLKREGLSPL